MRSLILGEIPSLDYASTEAINTLATNVTFSGSQYKSIMLTSCTSNEGKSYVAFNLVRALGNMGYATLLVDADLRKSVLFSRYDMRIQGPKTGLTHYLAGRCSAANVLYKTNIPNMYMIPAGKEVINSLPLLTSPALANLLEDMKASFDFIIVDASPVGLVIDAAMIANVCDATILVINNEQVTKRELAEAVLQIKKSGCTILGTVLNKVAMETHKSRKYYYKGYYSHYGARDYVSDNIMTGGVAQGDSYTADTGRIPQSKQAHAPAPDKEPPPADRKDASPVTKTYGAPPRV